MSVEISLSKSSNGGDENRQGSVKESLKLTLEEELASLKPKVEGGKYTRHSEARKYTRHVFDPSNVNE